MSLTKPEVEKFKNYIVRGELKNDETIVEKIENFLFDWIKQDNMNREDMRLFAEVMISIPEYRFEGLIYRGVFNNGAQDFDIQRNLYNSAASFTDYENVALHFAGVENEDYEEAPENKIIEGDKAGYLIFGEAKNAFSFDGFLIDYKGICLKKELVNIIDSYLWENEKIHTDEEIHFSIKKYIKINGIVTCESSDYCLI